jgi:hypothetical protein
MIVIYYKNISCKFIKICCTYPSLRDTYFLFLQNLKPR